MYQKIRKIFFSIIELNPMKISMKLTQVYFTVHISIFNQGNQDENFFEVTE